MRHQARDDTPCLRRHRRRVCAQAYSRGPSTRQLRCANAAPLVTHLNELHPALHISPALPLVLPGVGLVPVPGHICLGEGGAQEGMAGECRKGAACAARWVGLVWGEHAGSRRHSPAQEVTCARHTRLQGAGPAVQQQSMCPRSARNFVRRHSLAHAWAHRQGCVPKKARATDAEPALTQLAPIACAVGWLAADRRSMRASAGSHASSPDHTGSSAKLRQRSFRPEVAKASHVHRSSSGRAACTRPCAPPCTPHGTGRHADTGAPSGLPRWC